MDTNEERILHLVAKEDEDSGEYKLVIISHEPNNLSDEENTSVETDDSIPIDYENLPRAKFVYDEKTETLIEVT